MTKLTRVWLFAAVAAAFCVTLATVGGGVNAPVAAAAATALSPPLAFERNDGQHPDGIQFAARGAGYAFGFTERSVHIALRRPRAFLSLRIAGTPQPPAGESILPGRVNYLSGSEQRDWTIGIPTFGRIRYARAWPGIDVLFYGHGAQLEYDVIVAPGAELNKARLEIGGADTARVDGDGTLVIASGGEQLRFSRPVAYQEIRGVRRPVDARYELNGRTIGFAAGAYDRRHTLVIDPVLVFSTYFGGSAFDEIGDVAVDVAGHVYVTGATRSMDLPTTPGVYRRTPPGAAAGYDVFVSKLHRDGTSLIYSTFIGGGTNSFGRAIAVDFDGNAYVGGHTNSAGTGFPTTAGAYRRVNPGGGIDGYETFVLKLSTSGGSLVWSTLLGGSEDEYLADIAVDVTGAPVVVGQTDSTDFPKTPGTIFNPVEPVSLRGVGFVTRINRTGTALISSQWMGLSASGVAIDPADGRSWVTGAATADRPIPATSATAIQRTFAGGTDAYLVILNRGGGYEYGSYFGGPDFDEGRAAAFDPNGTVYIAGTTRGGFPTSDNAGRRTPYGGADGFVVRLDSDGSRQRFASLYGGTGDDWINAIDVNLGGFPIITGYTTAAEPTHGAFPGLPREPGEREDVFMARLFGNTGEVNFGTVLGGNGADLGRGIGVHSAGRYVFGGATTSTDLPLRDALDPANTCHPESTWCDDGFVAAVAEMEPRSVSEQDVVFHSSDAQTYGAWRLEPDPTAADGQKLRHPNAGAPRVSTPLANPVDYIEFEVPGLHARAFTIWIRGKADNNDYSNDSVWVQFSNATDVSGNPVYRIGTTQAMPITLEECIGCNLRGWAWQDGTFGFKKVGPLLEQPGGPPMTVRIQTREDGISIDQVLIDVSYYPHAPGFQKDDNTILPQTGGDPGVGDDVVIYTGVDAPQLHGSWRLVADSTAAGGRRLHQPDVNAPKITAPLANPVHYVEYTFEARSGIRYGVWLRGRADRDDPYNDSVYLQFSNTAMAPGTTSAMTVNLERCSGAGLSGWTWRSGFWCAAADDPEPMLIEFATGGTQTLRIQAREDGISIDQVVISDGTYGDGPPPTPIVPR